MKIGLIIIIKGIEVITPIITRRIASFPFPSFRSSWPGRTERKDSESVAPVNIEGIKSKIVWVIAKETTKEINANVDTDANIPKFATNIAVTVLICIPGVIPVNVPINIPAIMDRMISTITLLITV